MTADGASNLTGTGAGSGGAPTVPRVAPGEIDPEEVLSEAVKYVPELSELTRLFYRHVPVEELAEDDPRDLAGAVKSHLQLADERAPGRPMARVLNPNRTEDGWTCEYTVVQVVTDDMPYLVDSVMAELSRSQAQPLRVVHPLIVVRRDPAGKLQQVLPQEEPEAPQAGASVESWMMLEIEPVTDPERARDLEQRLMSVLNDVREVVEDTERMHEIALALAGELESSTAPPPVEDTSVADTAGLLRWLTDGHFTFLGYRHYEVVTEEERGEPALRGVLASGLGVLRRDSLAVRSFIAGPDGTVHALDPELLVLTQASAPSTVYRPVYPFYVGVKTFDPEGSVTGEHRFLGVFTTTALHEDVLDIPVIERRVHEIIHRAGFPMESYSGQRMLEVVQNYPRSELFASDTESLYHTVTGVLALAERRTLRLFLRRDPYQRFFSCLVYLPRDRYTTSSRLAMQQVLMDELQGTGLEYSTRVGESQLARVHFTVHTDPEVTVTPDVTDLQQQLAHSTRSWDDLMTDAVGAERERAGSGNGRWQQTLPSESALEQGQRFAAWFPESYKEDFDAHEALRDLRKLEALSGAGDLDLLFYVPRDASAGQRRLKLYLAAERVTLSAVLPVLQHMGVVVVDERPYEVRRDDGTECWIYDFGLRIDSDVWQQQGETNLDRLRERFQNTFAAVWKREAESDNFNALVLAAGLNWRQVSLLRTFAKYLRQAGIPYSISYVEDVMRGHCALAARLVELFTARFDPGLGEENRTSKVETLTAELDAGIDEVTSLDADRILRSVLGVVQATLRTNYFVRDPEGNHRPYISLKLQPERVAELPEPRPRFEIFVFSPRVEGVHLRFGAVARGGLRWSDRREDFRTEVLGLAKAQAAKNAVIVPVGAKGGFVVKQPPAATGDPAADRDAWQAEGIACYRLFISGLLEITDNRVAGTTTPPPEVVRYDGDDAYLVVAADKGTATFSDIANEVAASYDFWLGDAFASGGSEGYDHKEMGITARGAWESVKRHFRELGLDTQSEEFSVVGVGDMSGDVFGNGMLLSHHIRLLAAFDHRHIFVDPDPDPEASFAERSRLFELGRSSWDDYDRGVISAGGGVWPRTDKAIPVSEQMRSALGLDERLSKLTPQQLMSAILLAPADLFWNGGIGTYVKSSTQSNAEVGDKTNDGLRVDGNQLRVRVIGEGGNLGLTQRGRIEFAANGGKVNTDALDNSAGVETSDHEVNIKILLDALVSQQRLRADERGALLGEMTEEVASLVLDDNYSQNALLGVSRAHAVPMVSVHARLVTALERSRGLDRELEALPGPQAFDELEAAGRGLTSPELATLVAHVKLALKADVLDSELPDAEVFARRLPEYFPSALRERFPDAADEHPLRREIVTTMLVNEVIDNAGITYAHRLAEETSASSTDAVRAFAVATAVFDLPSLWREITALDTHIATSVADTLVLEVRRLMDRAARWLLSNRPQPLAVGAEINRFRPAIHSLTGQILELLQGSERESAERRGEQLAGQGAPEGLAARVGALLHAFGLLDVVEIAELAEQDPGLPTERSPQESAELYFALSEHLGIDHMLTEVTHLERGDRWHALARLALRDDLYSSLRAITLDVLRASDPGDSSEQKIAHWEANNASRLQRARSALEELGAVQRLDLATLSVAAQQIRSMVR